VLQLYELQRLAVNVPHSTNTGGCQRTNIVPGIRLRLSATVYKRLLLQASGFAKYPYSATGTEPIVFQEPAHCPFGPFSTGAILWPCCRVAAPSIRGVVKLPEEIEFKGPLSGAPQTVVLYGDPSKPGLFVTRVRFSPGWKDMPHWHPDEARTVAVLSGTFYFGSGEAWDETKMKAYPAGTFYSEPPRAPHFTWAKDGEVVIQVTGIGPSCKTFIKQ
jgi:quercetin dioxygenase-like cupin family protein